MKIKEIWFEKDQIYGRDENGQVHSQSLLWYPRLKAASATEREKYTIGLDGLHWRNVDEDISFESFLYDIEMITVTKIWLTEDAVWIRTSEGKEACEYYVDYPRLRYATPEQRSNYETDEYGIHWPDIDEDLSYEGFFQSKQRTDLYRIFMLHPELNASAVARRLGISQSLFAQYISGFKKPSQKRLEEIYATIRQIGKELIAV